MGDAQLLCIDVVMVSWISFESSDNGVEMEYTEIGLVSTKIADYRLDAKVFIDLDPGGQYSIRAWFHRAAVEASQPYTVTIRCPYSGSEHSILQLNVPYYTNMAAGQRQRYLFVNDSN